MLLCIAVDAVISKTFTGWSTAWLSTASRSIIITVGALQLASNPLGNFLLSRSFRKAFRDLVMLR